MVLTYKHVRTPREGLVHFLPLLRRRHADDQSLMFCTRDVALTYLQVPRH